MAQAGTYVLKPFVALLVIAGLSTGCRGGEGLPAGACKTRDHKPQAKDAHASKFREATRKMKATRPDLFKVRSPALSEALKDTESLWKFMASPETPYTDRRAAALQGRDVFPVEWLPRLMAAIGELRKEAKFHYWALKQNPLDNRLMLDPERRFLKDIPPDQRERRVLGQRWVVPTEALDYPLTWKEEAKAPWPWQVEQTLDDLFVFVRPNRRDEAKARQWLKAAMRIPCTTDEEATLFVEASRWATHFKTMPVMARWHKIVLDPRFPEAAARVGWNIREIVRLWDDPRSWAVGQVLTVDTLKHSPHNEAKYRTAYGLRYFRERWRTGKDLRMPEPTTAIIAASQMALDPKNGDEWTRLYVYAFSVCEALDSPPMKPDRHMDPKSEEVGKTLGKFESWFKASEKKLEALAAKESVALAGVRKTLKNFE